MFLSILTVDRLRNILKVMIVLRAFRSLKKLSRFLKVFRRKSKARRLSQSSEKKDGAVLKLVERSQGLEKLPKPL